MSNGCRDVDPRQEAQVRRDLLNGSGPPVETHDQDGRAHVSDQPPLSEAPGYLSDVTKEATVLMVHDADAQMVMTRAQMSVHLEELEVERNAAAWYEWGRRN